ncbi:MAG TPA: hypothetical protein VFP52_06275, partial [Myxococcales bacterium]|nr:hypothetical protein [Myxococcales bacterium]
MGRLPLSRVRPELRSRHGRPPGRYFPEIAEALRPSGPAFDGELLVAGAGGSDFAALLNRLHPSKTRVDELAPQDACHHVVFDLLDEPDLPFAPRRRGRARLVPEQLPEGRGAHRHGHRSERQDGALLPDRRRGGAGSGGAIEFHPFLARADAPERPLALSRRGFRPSFPRSSPT